MVCMGKAGPGGARGVRGAPGTSRWEQRFLKCKDLLDEFASLSGLGIGLFAGGRHSLSKNQPSLEGRALPSQEAPGARTRRTQTVRQ